MRLRVRTYFVVASKIRMSRITMVLLILTTFTATPNANALTAAEATTLLNNCIAAINVEIKFWVITQQIESSIIDSKFCLGYSKDLNSMLKQINSIIL